MLLRNQTNLRSKSVKFLEKYVFVVCNTNLITNVKMAAIKEFPNRWLTNIVSTTALNII